MEIVQMHIENISNWIRSATIVDIPEMTKLNLECRKHNYKWIVSQDFLDNLNLEEKIQSWETHFLEVQNSMSYYVKLIDGKIVWFISGGKNRDLNYPYENEIVWLYVDIHYQNQSIGKGLFQKLLEDERFKNCKSFYLWTLQDNKQSNYYYQKMWGKLLFQDHPKIHERARVPLSCYVREK